MNHNLSRVLFAIALILFCVVLFAQEVKTQKPLTYATEQLAVGSAKPTTYFHVTKDKQRQTIYVTKSGSHYYVTKTKSGEYRRTYIKLPVDKANTINQ